MRATNGRPFFIVSSAITGRDAATTVLAGASVRLQKEVLVDYRLERLLHGGVEAELTQLAHALDGRAAGGAHRVHECDWVLGAVHSKRAAAHNRRGGDLLGDRSCKFRADTRLRQSVNVHQNKRARCPAESSECRKQVFIYSSSIWYTLYALPTDENIASAVFICALVAALPPYIAVTETFYT